MSKFHLVGGFRAQPGQGDALASHLLKAADALRGNGYCDLYLVSRSPADPDSIWVTEVRRSRESHQVSLEGVRVRELIVEARPLIAGVGERFELAPIGGKGFSADPH